MDIRTSLDGLKSLLGVSPAPAAAPQGKSNTAATTGALTSDSATLSSTGSEASLAVADSGVRPEKVAGIQAALMAGTYNAPSSAVASKMVDAMLGNAQ